MKYSIVVSFSLLVLIASKQAFSADACSDVLTSKAFNKSDFTQSTSLIMKKKDDACNREYDSKEEAYSSGRSAGGNIGYGGFTLGASEAVQKGNQKYSISESNFCKATAEDIESFTSTTAKQQIVDTALAAWTECIKDKENLFIEYQLNDDSTGMTGSIIRKPGHGSMGEINAINTSNSAVEVKCVIGSKSVITNKKLNPALPIAVGKTAISCSKLAKSNVKISLSTTAGDPDWISLPSSSAQKQTTIDQANEAINHLRKNIMDIEKKNAETEAKLLAENKYLRETLDKTNQRISAITLKYIKFDAGNLRKDIGPGNGELACPDNTFAFKFKNNGSYSMLDMWWCAGLELVKPDLQ